MPIDKQEIEKVVGKEVAKQLAAQPDEKLMEIAKAATHGLKLKLKSGVFMDTHLKNKEAGVVAEIWETKSNKKILDGISLDLGLTNKNLLAGVAKDINLNDMEFSIGVYAAFDTNKVINTLTTKSSEVKPQLRIGVSMNI